MSLIVFSSPKWNTVVWNSLLCNNKCIALTSFAMQAQRSKMDNTSQFFSNCSDLSIKDTATINLAFCVTGGICCCIAILITLVLVICRAYKSVLQRLFLYVMVTTIVRELFLAASIEHQFKYKGQEQVCTWIAFFYNWAGIIKFVHTVGIMIYLFFLVRCIAKGEKALRLLQTKSRRVVAEILYVFLSFFLSLGYATVPLFTHNYGLAGSWCWIKALDDDCNLTLTGLLNQLLSGYVFYIFGGVISVIMLIVVAVVYSSLPLTLREARLLLRKISIIIMCFMIFTGIILIALSMRVVTATAKSYQLAAIWLVAVIAFPISLLLFPIAFLFSFYPVGKAFKLCYGKICCGFYKKDKPVHSKPRVHFRAPTDAPTYPVSTRVSPASHTVPLPVPYTNEFTDITTSTAPLISEGRDDTGYGSTTKL